MVLYNRSAESSFTDPFAAGDWAAGKIPTWEHLLSPRQLRGLGYGYLAEQLTRARATGLEAKAWLPFGSGPAAMARCCAAWGVTHVVLPAQVAHPSWWARLRGHTLTALRARLPGVEILLADADGGVQRIAAAVGAPQSARTAVLV